MGKTEIMFVPLQSFSHFMCCNVSGYSLVVLANRCSIYIEKMDLYQELVEMKSEDEPDKEIFGRKYFEFLDEFFSEQNQSSLLVVLKKGFETTFHN